MFYDMRRMIVSHNMCTSSSEIGSMDDFAPYSVKTLNLFETYFELLYIEENFHRGY